MTTKLRFRFRFSRCHKLPTKQSMSGIRQCTWYLSFLMVSGKGWWEQVLLAMYGTRKCEERAFCHTRITFVQMQIWTGDSACNPPSHSLSLRKRCDLDLDLRISINSQAAFTIPYKWDRGNKIQNKEDPSRAPEENHSTVWLLRKALETNSMQMYVIRSHRPSSHSSPKQPMPHSLRCQHSTLYPDALQEQIQKAQRSRPP